ncbi:MAG TPA: polysaccharide deacetylase family protein [Solirubrobacterales bacterium]|nr:polysaccharide deacetylase family protein [Solirubrobacterales bacterium]
MIGPLHNRSRQAIFLCYHSVTEEGPRYLTVDPELFERQLAALRRRGLRSGTAADLETMAAGGRIEPSVFITFDDGFRDNHTTVLPLLRAYGFGAFCFVLPPLVDDGAPLSWPEVAEDQRRFSTTMRSVTWPMVEEMAAADFTIGSHGLTHAHLSQLGPEQLRQELSDSRARICARLGSCETLAYPFGDWSPAVEAAAAACGYRFAFTLPTKVGQHGTTPLSLPRVNVDYRDRGLRFQAKLSWPGRRIYLSSKVAAARRRLRGGSSS